MTTTWEVGDEVDWNDLNQLPPTTRVRDSNGYQYLRKPNGMWMQMGFPDNNWTPADFARETTIEFVPVPTEKQTAPPMTFAKWEAQFVNTVREHARAHGVGSTTINRAFERIGVDPNAVENGLIQPGEKGGSRGALRMAPAGTLVADQRGRVWEKRSDNGYWNPVAPVPGSSYDCAPNNWTMIRWGADGDLTPVTYSVEVDEAEQDRLAATKARAWKVGMELKREHGWCSTLESILRYGGVTRADAHGVNLGRGQQARLPEGSILVYQVGEQFDILIRDDNARNAGRTRHLVGNTGRSGRARADLGWRAGTEWDGITLNSASTREALRVLSGVDGLVVEVEGSTYRVNGGRLDSINSRNGSRRYTNAARAEVHQTYNVTDFGGGASQMTILYYPGITP